MGKRISPEERERKELELEERYHQQLSLYNLKQFNITKNWKGHTPDPHAWEYGIAWDEEKQKYVLTDTAFSDGFKQLEEIKHKKKK